MKVRRYGKAIIGGLVVRGKDRDQLQALLLGVNEGDRVSVLVAAGHRRGVP